MLSETVSVDRYILKQLKNDKFYMVSTRHYSKYLTYITSFLNIQFIFTYIDRYK